jgi:large subunit ribosomal protein L23
MHSVYEIVVRPIITEKSTNELDRRGAYSFVVAKDANKIQIAKAIETLFNVRVKAVRTMQYRGKTRRVGRFIGKRPAWKKAIVTLAEGDTIQIFEGV